MHRLQALSKSMVADPRRIKKLLSVPAVVWQPHTNVSVAGWERTKEIQVHLPKSKEDRVVSLLEKVPGRKNPFSMGVTVGRIEDNDIVVDDASVSRFHAYFLLDEKAHEWKLADADSKNGTFLDGFRLGAKKRLPVRDGAEVRFGEVSGVFLLPASLVKLVQNAG